MLNEKEEDFSHGWSWFSDPNVWIGLFLSSLFINLLSLAFPLALLQIYDRIIPNAATNTLLLLIAGVACALLLETFLRIARSIINAWAESREQYRFVCETYDQVLKTPIHDFEKKGAGYHLEAFSGLKSLKNTFGEQYAIVLLDLSFVLVFLLAVAYLGGLLVLVSLATIFFSALLALVNGWCIESVLKKRKSIDDRRMNFIIESMVGIQTIKSMAMESFMARRYERLQKNVGVFDHKIALLASSSQSLSLFISQAGVVLIVTFGGIGVIHGSMTVGALAACTLLSIRVLQPVNQAMEFWKKCQFMKLEKKRLEEIKSLPQETSEIMPRHEMIHSPIEMRDLSFSFEENKPLIKNVNLIINKGDFLVITGKNLSGRSTLLWLIHGLCKPTQGQVLMGGVPVNELSSRVLRKEIMYVPRSDVLFEGSIMDNLTLFRGAEYQEIAKQYARLLEVEEVILRLPNGYETRVGNRSVDILTPGLKQKIVIARALINEPSVLLLDDVTTGLDQYAEEGLYKALARLKGRCTIVMVTNKISFIKMATRNYKMSNGSLEEAHYVVTKTL